MEGLRAEIGIGGWAGQGCEGGVNGARVRKKDGSEDKGGERGRVGETE